MLRSHLFVLLLLCVVFVSSVLSIHQNQRLTQLSSHKQRHQEQQTLQANVDNDAQETHTNNQLNNQQQSQHSVPNWLKNPFSFGSKVKVDEILAQENAQVAPPIKPIVENDPKLKNEDKAAWSAAKKSIDGVVDRSEKTFYQTRLDQFTKNIASTSNYDKVFTHDIKQELVKLLTEGNKLIETALNDKQLYNRTDDKLKGTYTDVGIKWAKMVKLADLKAGNIASKLAILVRATNEQVLQVAVNAIETKQKEQSFQLVKGIAIETSIEPKLNQQTDKWIPGAPGSPVWTAAGRSSVGVCLQSTNAQKWNRRDKFIGTWHGHSLNGAHVQYRTWAFNLRIGAIEAQEHTTADWDRVNLRGLYSCTCGGAIAATYANANAVAAQWAAEALAGTVPGLSSIGSTSGATLPRFATSGLFYSLTVANGWPAGTTNVVAGGTQMWLFHTTEVTLGGDSGGPLVYNGQVIGILKGSVPGAGGANDDVWTPIWNIPIPANYAIC